MRRRTLAAIAVLAMVVVSGFAAYEEYYAAPGSQCDPIPPGTVRKSQVTSTAFGAVTEWALPSQGRWPNAVAVASDGSIWFAEEEVPGVAHLYPSNGTLVEYPWPGYATPKPPDCSAPASSFGIAIWGGRVWATDQFADHGTGAVIGLDPGDGSVVKVNATTRASSPYWVASGPDGNLWFTSDNTTQHPARLGRIYPNLTLSVVNLVGVPKYEEPIQLDFVNSSLAFVSALDVVTQNSTTKDCVCEGHIYSFNPSDPSTSIPASVVGGSYKVLLPSSVSYSDGRVWVAQHGPSSVLSYDLGTKVWTKYPTSLVPWSTSLPYYVYASGNEVMFNEHYANKIALLHVSAGTLTEYSESTPPASGPQGIQNDESIAPAGGGLWFSSLSGNYVGFVSSTYAPSFSVSSGTSTVSLAPGGKVSVPMKVTGTWSTPLGVNASDSEGYSSVPNMIGVAPGVSTIPPAGPSPYTLNVEISVRQSTAPGNYTVAVTVTAGGVQQTRYIFLVVT